MANFTDNPSALANFNPYIQQLPVDAMVQVGVEKQKRYDEGIQKIQSNIENIAGLDVIRDVDKQYLQSKLNQLGSKLKTVAAGDFSNYQLTNSVGGMVNQIGKDPLIQNAVGSTMRVRKEQAKMEEADKAGKSSIQNKEWFNNSLNNWLNNSDIKTPFTGQYVQYIDVDKKLRDVAEKVHETDNSIDIPYQRDATGNILYFSEDPKTKAITASTDPSNGKPRIDDAMLSIKTKGKPAEKILANFYDSLTADDQNQLKIDSWYHYRGANRDTFVNDAARNYNENKKLLSDSVVEMNLQLATNPSLSSAQRSQLQAKINYTESQLNNGDLLRDYQKQVEEIDNSPNVEDYKYKLYTQKYLTNLAKDMSYQSIQQEIKSNPYAQMDMEKRRLQQSYDEMNAVESRFKRSYGLQAAEFSWKQKMDLANLDLKQKELDAKNALPVGDVGRLSTNVEAPTITGMEKEIHSLVDSREQLNAQYAPQIDPTFFKNVNANTPGLQRAYLNQLASSYAKDPSFLNNIKDNNVREYLTKRRELDGAIARKHQTYIDVINKSKGFDEQISASLEAAPPISIGGRKYNAKDLYEIYAGFEAITSPGALATAKSIGKDFVNIPKSIGSVFGISESPKDERAIALKNYVEQFKGTSKEELANSLLSGNPLNSVRNAMAKVYRDNKDRVGKIYDEKLNFQSQELSKFMPERQTTNFTLDIANNKHDETAVNAIVGKAMEDYTLGGVDVTKNADYEPATVQAILKDPHHIARISKNYDGTANLKLISGDVVQTIPIDADYFSATFPKYSVRNPIDDIKGIVNGSPYRTTNLSNSKDASSAVNAYMSGYNIPNLKDTPLAPLVRFDVEGSPNNTGDGNDQFQVRMYVHTKEGWKQDLITYQGYVNAAGLQAVFNNIGPATVEDFLKKNK